MAKTTNQLSMKAELALVRWLAARESPWRPVRQLWRHGQAIEAARRDGSVWTWGEAGDAQTRKASQRERDDLTAAGLLKGGAITPAGKRLARSWTWPYTVRQLQTAVNRIVRARERRDSRSNGEVPETFVAGACWGESPDPFAQLQVLLTPLLADGVVSSHCTTQGHCYYAIIVPVDSLPECVKHSLDPWSDLRPALCDVYDREYRAAWQRIVKDTRKFQSVGEIPLPLGMSVESDRDYNDLKNLKPLFPYLKAENQSNVNRR